MSWAKRAKRDGSAMIWLIAMMNYLRHHEQNPRTHIHPTHKTPEEKKELKKKRAKRKRKAKK